MQPDAVTDAGDLTLSQLKERGAQVIAKFREATLAHESMMAGWQQLRDCPQLYCAKLLQGLDRAIAAVPEARAVIAARVCTDFDRLVLETKLKSLHALLCEAVAQAQPAANGSVPLPEKLTRREREVLKYIADGHSTKQIAQMMGITFKTAACHRYRIMDKLGIHETATLVRCAIRVGFVQP